MILNALSGCAFFGEDREDTTMKRTVALMVFVIVCLQVAAISFLRRPMVISHLVILFCALFAALACYRRGARSSGPARRKWDFVAIGLALWAVGQAIYLLRLVFPWANRASAIGPEFYFLVYGVPLLLAISSSNEDRDSTLLVMVDSFQAVFAVGVTYLEFFFILPNPGNLVESAPMLIHVYAIENWVLLGATLLRLLAKPRGEERALYRILCGYFLLSALLPTPIGVHAAISQIPLGVFHTLLWDIPFLVLAAACLLVPIGAEPDGGSIEMNPFALVLNNGSPILFTLAVLAMGASIARHRFVLGIAAISISLVIYCFRAALLQSAYMQAQHALTRSQHALRDANARLKQLSLLDALTGVANRRQFDQTLELEWNRAQRTGRPLSLLILDVDCFKALNDRYGHQVGDECLSRIAAALQDSLRRAGELVARYGGEEFAAILPGVEASGAVQLAESMRQAVLSLEIENQDSLAHRYVTASIGVATQNPQRGTLPAELITAADNALYRAKRNGRHRVESADCDDATGVGTAELEHSS